MNFYLMIFLFSIVFNVSSFAEETKTEMPKAEVSKTDKEKNEEKPKNVKRKPAAKRSECTASDEALKDISDKTSELEEREKKLTEMETAFSEKEKVLKQQLKQLEDLKKEIALNQTQGDSKNEEKIVKLVEAIEKMSPKKASELLASLNNTLAVESMMRLSTEKLAKVMNLMDVKRSSQLSELLTKVRPVKGQKKEGGDSESTKNTTKDS